MEIAYQSDRGRVRQLNEDDGAILYDNAEDLLFAIVADGMGGHKAGDVASQMVVESLKESWKKRGTLTEDMHEAWLTESITKANFDVYSYATKNPECSGMGTTLVGAICCNNQVTICHVGDSRCYHGRQGELTQVTTDHTLVHELIRLGQITEEEAETHPRKNVIMRSVGTDPTVNVDIIKVDWKPGDYLLLCSDGLSNKLTTDEMIDILYSEKEINDKAKAMVDLANIAGGEDNITIAIVHFPLEIVGEDDAR